MKNWFISDIHIKNKEERNSQILLRFLHSLLENPSENRLFLLGDIFDFWLSDGSAFEKAYDEIVQAIASLKKAGTQVVYFEGNHDFHIDRYWTTKYEIPVIEDLAYVEIDGLILRLEHGDFINPQDTAYLKYRSFIRHPLVEMVGHTLPSHFWKWFGDNQSQRSRKKTARYAIENEQRLRTLIRHHALLAYTEKPFDILIAGHMHLFDEFEFAAGDNTIKSFNLGTWLEKPRALKLESGRTEIVELS